MITVKSRQGFKRAVLEGEDEIRVEDPKLAKWVIMINGVKQIAWSVAIVSIGIAIGIVIGTAGAGVHCKTD